MGYARQSLVCLKDTPYYHVVARCVRRAWLWGVDEYARRDYSHRKQWIIDRLQFLSSVFAIDICAYAVMSNHYHLVLHVDQLRAATLSDLEVIDRWSKVFGVPTLLQRWQEGARALDACPPFNGPGLIYCPDGLSMCRLPGVGILRRRQARRE